MKIKTFSVELNYWESVTIYELLKNEYCDMVDALKKDKKTKKIYKDYNTLLDKFENAIGNTIDNQKD